MHSHYFPEYSRIFDCIHQTCTLDELNLTSSSLTNFLTIMPTEYFERLVPKHEDYLLFNFQKQNDFNFGAERLFPNIHIKFSLI